MTTGFKKIGLWGRLADNGVAELGLKIISQLQSAKLKVVIPEHNNIPKEFNKIDALPADELASKVDLIIAVGGDGTLLHSARKAAVHSVPLLGVNRGRLGFLTDISPELMTETIETVLAGEYVSEERLMLEASITSSEKSTKPMLALNDVALKTSHTGHMQDFHTSIDGEYVNTHCGDGLIIATPTGSTAYALSCGGPIIKPDVGALVITPIAPHTLSDRPLVIRSTSKVDIRVDPRSDSQLAAVACDGEDLGEMKRGDTLTITTSEKTVRLLHPQGHSYYELLRSKLSWGQDNRSHKSNHKLND
tara:strand:+ start:1544 stop:2458 length:915 start_codon:yes stop_codon:yes gene_type:complete